jgi:hypothetical protein
MHCHAIVKQHYAKEAPFSFRDALPPSDSPISLDSFQIRLAHNAFGPFHRDTAAVRPLVRMDEIRRELHRSMSAGR